MAHKRYTVPVLEGDPPVHVDDVRIVEDAESVAALGKAHAVELRESEYTINPTTKETPDGTPY